MSSCKADGVIKLWLLLSIVEQDGSKPFQKDGLYISFRSGEERPTTIFQKIHLLSIFICISINNYEESYHITFQTNGREFVGHILNSSGKVIKVVTCSPTPNIHIHFVPFVA